MNKKRFITLWFIFSIAFTGSLHAQTASESLSKTILQLDSAFWTGYNTCNLNEVRKYFSDDVEFYHDKGGFSQGVNTIMNTTQKNLCSNPDFHLRREALKESMHVFPLSNGQAIYGAVLTGEHIFYVIEKNKERLDGISKFTHVWVLKDGQWKMNRILSYDHQSAAIRMRKQTTITDAELNRFVGTYRSPNFGNVQIQKGAGILKMTVGEKEYQLLPETNNRFFVKDRDLTFEFVTNEKKKHFLIVRENGQIVEEIEKLE